MISSVDPKVKDEPFQAEESALPALSFGGWNFRRFGLILADDLSQ